jgi:hypothetical protein
MEVEEKAWEALDAVVRDSVVDVVLVLVGWGLVEI